ncbi:ATP-binding protein [Streptomyces sp. E5N91]|uniref:ATP-binding protein n=1 Tax=Streptomyces sp. E5N91 TaxID=1851996 RepID=UPI000EF56FBC|nr:ATP-binding protein [Streptomyces sp. E5N91]
MTDTGDLHATLALQGDGGCIARARRFSVDFLTRAQHIRHLAVSRRAVEVTQLVVSELVTNACKYAPGPLLMDLTLLDHTVRVEVWDSDPVLPLARAADAGRVGQHGLEIVLLCAQSFEARREPVGKCVIATVALADDPGGAPAGHRPR